MNPYPGCVPQAPGMYTTFYQQPHTVLVLPPQQGMLQPSIMQQVPGPMSMPAQPAPLYLQQAPQPQYVLVGPHPQQPQQARFPVAPSHSPQDGNFITSLFPIETPPQLVIVPQQYAMSLSRGDSISDNHARHSTSHHPTARPANTQSVSLSERSADGSMTASQSRGSSVTDAVCRHYLKGKCNRRKCRFRHALTLEEQSAMQQSALQQSTLPQAVSSQGSDGPSTEQLGKPAPAVTQPSAGSAVPVSV